MQGDSTCDVCGVVASPRISTVWAAPLNKRLCISCLLRRVDVLINETLGFSVDEINCLIKGQQMRNDPAYLKLMRTAWSGGAKAEKAKQELQRRWGVIWVPVDELHLREELPNAREG